MTPRTAFTGALFIDLFYLCILISEVDWLLSGYTLLLYLFICVAIYQTFAPGAFEMMKDSFLHGPTFTGSFWARALGV
jgi:hypothetical protein